MARMAFRMLDYMQSTTLIHSKWGD